MSEKEKSKSSEILEALTSLEAAKGPEYVKGLVDGINLGTTQPPKDVDAETN